MATLQTNPDPAVLQRLRAGLRKAGLDAAVAMSQDNAAYTLGVGVPSHRLIRERRVAVLVPCEQAPAVVAVTVEESFLQANTSGVEIRPYDEHTETAMQVLARLLAERGLATGRIGLEMDFIAAADYAELIRLLPGAAFADAATLFKRSRWVKTPRELERVRRGGRIADEAVREAFTAASAGMTERDLAVAMTEEFLRRGGDDIRMVVVGAGERSSHPNAPPTDRPLARGDIVRVDFLGTVGGYCTDCARTAVVGEPTSEQRRIYGAIASVHREVLSRIGPGCRTRDLYDLYDARAREHRLQPLRFLGHGLGLGLHEGPFIDHQTDVVMEPGMVFAIEPVHFVPHEVGFHLEDVVVVTPAGCEVVTDATQTATLWPIRA
ncbi:MAG: Xaa-Pro peptidase family protein [Armatimonadota bacterium]|nr:Xaa-Pro peptidase family protein [Armatimonadota bacterium]MDR7549597.1 Xaa-Pro peptidase family protein [Armatimonadota bacterium]